MSFIVAPADIRFFRVRFSNFSCDIDRSDPNYTNFRVVVNFDSFRTFYTSKSNTSIFQPTWDGFELSFIYQTEMAELLIAKRCAISLECHDRAKSEGQAKCFIGQASVDLLTLAAGPSDVTLQLCQGNIAVGRIFLSIEMQEITEMSAEAVDWRLYPKQALNVDLKDLRLRVFKRGTTNEYFDAEAKIGNDSSGSKCVHLSFPLHLFSVSMQQLAEYGGFFVELFRPTTFGRDLLGSTTILFVQSQLQYDESKRFATCKVDTVIDCGTGALARLCGTINLSHIPVFTQMYSGQTVDGVVVKGRAYPTATIMPPFTDEAPSDVKTSNEAKDDKERSNRGTPKKKKSKRKMKANGEEESSTKGSESASQDGNA